MRTRAHLSENGTTLKDDDPIVASPPVLIEWNDVEAYRAALADWDMHAIPLDRGRFRLSWTQRELAGVSLVRYSTDRAVRESYQKGRGSTAIALVLPGGEAPFRVRGAELEPMTLALLQPGREYEVVSPAGGSALEFHVPDDVLESLRLDRWMEPGVMSLRPDPLAAVALRDLVSPLVTVGEEHLAPPKATAAQVLEALAMTLDSTDSSAPPPPTVRLHGTYRRAIASIEGDPDPMLTVAELAARLGVSTRTLRYAFGNALGISPYQYMLRHRLTMIRRVLLDEATEHRTVLEILVSHGITHQGEFAGQYRQLFGETPSQTRAQTSSWRGRRQRRERGWAPVVPLSTGGQRRLLSLLPAASPKGAEEQPGHRADGQ